MNAWCVLYSSLMCGSAAALLFFLLRAANICRVRSRGWDWDLVGMACSLASTTIAAGLLLTEAARCSA